MRIVIDLQSIQTLPADGQAAQLELVQELLHSAGENTVLLALDGSGAAIDVLRAACAPLLPRGRIRVFELPPAPHHVPDTWGAAAPHLHAAFIASLAPDLVFVPAAFAAGADAWIDASLAPTVLSLDTAALSAAPRRERALAQAALLVSDDDAVSASLRARWPQAEVMTLAAEPMAAAARLWPAFERLAAASRAAADAAPVNPTRPRLAYISPLPPQKSGIADYSVELIAELDRYYDIELIVDHAGPFPARLTDCHPVRSVAWFEAHAGDYQRVLYHFGNSDVHRHMFGLLERHPGIVVLHDFYISGVLDNMERDGAQPHAFLQALFDSHGYTGLQAHRENGRNPSIWAYPVNKNVLDQATGVIVHSEFSRRLAQRWYGADSAGAWHALPLIRGLDGARDPQETRLAARAELGLDAADFIVCTFGMLGVTKLNDLLLEAFLASPLAADPRCRLVFVGENDPGQYGRELARRMADSGAAARISVTGFVSAETYHAYLAAADAAVQLRSQTRGETSASVLDCLLHGAPTVINAHGSSADLPDSVLIKLADACGVEELAAALGRLHAEPALRARLSRAGREYIAAEHAPARVGKLFYQAIEEISRGSAHTHYQRLLAQLARLPAPPEALLPALAGAIAANRPAQPPRQLLIDMSALVQSDHKTGIQRVVRSIVLALIKSPPPGYRIEPVYSEGGNRSYRYARSFTLAMLGVEGLQPEDAPVDLRAGDLFLGLDLFTNGTTQNQNLLLDMRRRGVEIQFVVYDLLPLLRPEAFPFGAQQYYSDYIDTAALVADGLICISRAVADEVADWLSKRPNRRRTPLQLGYFHLGADIDASAPSRGLPDNAAAVQGALAAAPTLLMVGTLEPRKGQAQALDAFELLWAEGVNANLVIVGKNGWMVDALVKRLEGHPQLGRRLFWLPGVSDEMLLQLYGGAAALLAASEGEGFGLPLIEAAQHGLPIIARGIPVFREVAGEHAFYFDGGAAALATALRDWLRLHRDGQAPASRAMPWLNWQQSAQQLVDVSLHGNWYRGFNPEGVAVQLLVDVSATSRNDLRTGIERVVRAQLIELMNTKDTRYHVLPIYLSDEGGRWHYRHARRYAHRIKGVSDAGVSDDEVFVGSGDVFYCPDLFPGPTVAAAEAGLYRRWREQGVQINFLIHDLLPVLRPEFFPPGADASHGAWLQCIAHEADRLVCISAAVADEMRNWMAAHGVTAPPQLAVVHHGADIAASSPSGGLPDSAAPLLATLAAAPGFLMVGTIEPRKGHLQAIDAFERLWADGVDAHLVIVGREGWNGVPVEQKRTVPQIVARLRQHPEAGKRLHWLEGISDEYLERVYAASACLLVPSEGEGFGLPLIEAARHGTPIVARDIPVFREVAAAHAWYFKGDHGRDLATALRAWLELHAGGKAIASTGMPRLTWEQNAQRLTGVFFPTS